MKPVLFRSFFLFGVAMFQFSFVNTLFVAQPISFPILLSVIVSYTLLKGFSFSWKWAIVGGLFFDAMTLGKIGDTSFELVLASAAFSIMERQFFFEYGIKRLFIVGISVWIFFGVFRAIEAFSSLVLFEKKSILLFFPLFFDLNFEVLLGAFVFSLFVFWFLFRLTASFERYVELFERVPLDSRKSSSLS